MSLKVGIVGLPNVGKSTLFNAITNLQVEAANYPFATIEPNVGIVALHDARIAELAKMVNPERIVNATIEFIDIAGLVQGSYRGEGRGNKFLANIREVDAILHVVRCFDDSQITHVIGQVNPLRDAEVINLELILADLETINNVILRLKKRLQSFDKQAEFEHDLAKRTKALLEAEKPARALELTDTEKLVLKSWQLLSAKPMLYVANVSEQAIKSLEQSTHFLNLAKFADHEHQPIEAISAQIEDEISKLDPGEQALFLQDLGVTESGLNKLTRAAFKMLGLCTYFTVGKKEIRAWVFKQGTNAQNCAGIIHSDFARGFIKAEIIAYEDYVALGGEQNARQAGKLRLEGRDYLMKDGDIVHFKFNI